MSKDSTSFVARLRHDFHLNPLGFRVELPDGSHAVVRAFRDDNGYRLHRVVGVTPSGRLCKLPAGVRRWYVADDLKLVYYTASANSVRS
jgi:hypothetical protein